MTLAEKTQDDAMRIVHKPFILNSLYKKFRLQIKYRRGNGVLKSGEIRVRGFVDIWNGTYHQRVKNHFVGTMLNQLINQIATDTSQFGNSIVSGAFGFGDWSGIGDSYMIIGTDTANKTIISTGGLSAPIGGASPIKPNTQSGSTQSISNGAAVVLTSTWNAGTVSGTVGEIGIYGRSNASTGLVGFGSHFYGGGGNFFASRLSVADGDFTAFTINTAAPLTINWTIQFTFQ
jgi:hypothetical protein